MERAAPASPLKHEAWLRRAQALDRLGRSEEAGRLLKRAGRRSREPAGGAGRAGAGDDRAGAQPPASALWRRRPGAQAFTAGPP